jgi:hypothetical protein
VYVLIFGTQPTTGDDADGILDFRTVGFASLTVAWFAGQFAFQQADQGFAVQAGDGLGFVQQATAFRLCFGGQVAQAHLMQVFASFVDVHGIGFCHSYLGNIFF